MNQNQKVKHQQKSPANPRCLDKNLAGSIEFWGARLTTTTPQQGPMRAPTLQWLKGKVPSIEP